jgi:hypothetical protein
MALKVVDKIVREMPENEKDRLFDAILSDKRVKDHVLKLIVWSFSGSDIKKDLSKTKKIRDISDKYEKRRQARERAMTNKSDK